MTLTPVNEIIKSDNPNFNWDAARKTYDALMKLDEEEVRQLTTLVTIDVLNDTIEKNLPILQKHLDEVIGKRVEIVKRAVVAKYRKDGPSAELIKMAGELEEISKATRNQYDFGYEFHEGDVRRNALGQFSTKIAQTQRRTPVKGKGAPPIPKFTDEKGKDVTLTTQQKTHYQNEYQQVASFLKAAQNSGMDLKNDDLRLRLQNRKTGEVYTSTLETKGGRPEPKTSAWDPRIERVVGIEARPTSLTAGGAAFNLIGALGDPGTGAAVGAGITAGGKQLKGGDGLKPFAQDWYGGYDELNDNAQLYGRLSSGGRFLAAVAPVGSKAQIAGTFSQFVGDHGPEAEKVFGPPTRRAMYRYRGIQRKVDESEIAEKTGKQVPATAGYAARWDRYKDYLAGELPKGGLSSLNLASGHTPPSEGIILDKNGKATVQALGYGDDHYLPFNLKQLKGLRGGEYIRTRSSGGPTSEDIYTGLMSGARAVTVVSRSGTFRIEFEPDFKGTRRYSQKAARMVGRYQRLLDAVRSREVERIPFDATRKRAIETEIRENYGNLPEPDIQDLITNRVNEVKNATTLPDDEQAEYDKWAKDFDEQNQDRKVTWRSQQKAAKYNSMLEAHQSNFKLNGTGYKAAMDALQEQFKYYIKDTHYRPRNADDDFYELGTDPGYVRPGALRPVAARGNFFGATNPASNQTFASAEKANYGDLTRKFGRSSGRAAELPTKATEEAAETTSTPMKPTEAVARAKQAIQERKAGDAFADKLLEFRKELQPLVPKDASATWINDDEATVRRNMRDGKNRQQVFSWLETASFDQGKLLDILEERKPGIRTRMQNLKAAGGKYGGKLYDKDEDRLLNPESPYQFTGPAFEPGQKSEVYMTAIHDLQRGDKPFTSDRPLSAMDESELRKEIDTAIEHHGIVEEAIKNGGGDGQVMAQIVNEGGLNLNRFPQVNKSIDPNKPSTGPMNDYLDRLHQIRAIRAASDAPVVPPKELNKRQEGLAVSFAEIPGLLAMMS